MADDTTGSERPSTNDDAPGSASPAGRGSNATGSGSNAGEATQRSGPAQPAAGSSVATGRASGEAAASKQEKRADAKSGDSKSVFGVIGEAFSGFSNDNCSTMAAALAYYTVFSLPPLLIVVIFVAGLFLDSDAAQQTIQQQAGSLVGEEGAEQIRTMIQNAGNLSERGPFGLIAGVAGLLFGATGAFAQLQTALNRAWEIEPDPESNSIVLTIFKRILSLGMVLGIAFLLLVSLALSAALSALSGWLAQFMPGDVSTVALFILDVSVSLAVITLLFAAIFKVLPDAKIAWQDVWMGGFATALLFVAGKFAIGFYLGKSNPGQAFGAAGSLALILVWVYYSAMIIFLGAEFTQSWARNKGAGIEPDDDAVRVGSEATAA